MRGRPLVALILVSIVALAAYLGHVSKQIARQSTLDESRPSDVILVLGAAEYRGRPSPVLQARLRHALALYEKGLAPFVMTTGGAGGDPRYTEAEVGRDYLIEHGVPSEDILTDAEGSTTGQSLDGAAEIMQRMNLHSCIVVSDGYHIFRVKRLLQAHHIQVYGSPRPEARASSRLEREWLYLKQAAGFVLWKIGLNM